MKQSFQDVFNQVASKQEYYSHDQCRRTLQEFYKAGAEDTVIAVAGYRLIVTHYDGVLIALRPKAASAGRGELVLWTGNPREDWITKVLDRPYFHDPFGPSRLQEALTIAYIAWETSNGVIEDLYKAVGARGMCACCGATLTDELSMSRGIGPECIKRVFKKEALAMVQADSIERASRPKEACPVCRLEVTVTKSGRLATHGSNRDRSIVCSGSGKQSKKGKVAA